MEAKKGLAMKERLRSLCCSNGWCYAVFWSFDQRNSLLLTAEDVYCEEQMQAVINEMLQKVHVFGEGLVGKAASTKAHKWVFSDVDGGKNCENSEIFREFSCGLKTIAVIFVESQGVLQLGSSRKILESMEFLDQMKKLFEEMKDSELTSPVDPSTSLNCENYELNEWFASFCNENISPIHGGSGNELIELACSSMNLAQPCLFTSDLQQEGMVPSSLDSFHLSDLHLLASEAQSIASDKFGAHLPQMVQQSASSIGNSSGRSSCISTPSNGDSVLTSLQSQRLSDLEVCDSLKLLPAKINYPAICSNKNQNLQDDIIATVPDRTTREIPEKLLSSFSASQSSMSKSGLAGNQSQVKCNEQLKPDDLLADRSNTYVMDNQLEWFRPSGEADVNCKPSQSVSSARTGHFSADNPLEQPSNSVQSSITATLDNSLEALALEFLSWQPRSYWENMTIPGVTDGLVASRDDVSQSISDMNISSMVAPRKALFSELGIKELVNGITSSNYISKTSVDNELSATKRKRVESLRDDGNQIQSANLSCSENSIRIPCSLKKNDNLPTKQEEGLLSWIDGKYGMNIGNSGQAKTRKPEETAKSIRKRARPGESVRPRPKDRQQIQDRLKELKGIIPGGEKCSIDALLDRTIKHMLFLQSITKYADKLKQASESKDTAMLLKDNSSSNSGSGGGATWALEVGDQTAVCPIRIEDISSSGLMLIEMLCDDRGFFLELADVIRSFGLNILKGVMEIQADKILARFIVEANTHMTRMEIFWSLVELVQQTTNSGFDSKTQPSNAIHGKDSLLSSYSQHRFENPIGLTDALQ